MSVWDTFYDKKWELCDQIIKKNQMFKTFRKGSSIHDVTVLVVKGQGFCDNSTRALVIKRVSMGGGAKGCSKLSKIAWRHLWMTPKWRRRRRSKMSHFLWKLMKNSTINFFPQKIYFSLFNFYFWLMTLPAFWGIFLSFFLHKNWQPTLTWTQFYKIYRMFSAKLQI